MFLLLSCSCMTWGSFGWCIWRGLNAPDDLTEKTVSHCLLHTDSAFSKLWLPCYFQPVFSLSALEEWLAWTYENNICYLHIRSTIHWRWRWSPPGLSAAGSLTKRKVLKINLSPGCVVTGESALVVTVTQWEQQLSRFDPLRPPTKYSGIWRTPDF